ncbi:hypothetical protein BGZ54_006543 [Gamsiella multidivaricata]|nr:hypothetical protein BGZ54_006543 [Gamsiella multidivaricata]
MSEVSYIPTDKNIVDEIRQPVSESLGATEDDVAVRSEYSITQAVKAMQQMTFFRQLQDCDTQKLVSMSSTAATGTVLSELVAPVSGLAVEFSRTVAPLNLLAEGAALVVRPDLIVVHARVVALATETIHHHVVVHPTTAQTPPGTEAVLTAGGHDNGG